MKGIEIIGYDSARKIYTDTSADGSGAAARGTMTSNAFTVKCGVSGDGKTWAPIFEGKWTKS